jgi:hypothetical protein
MMDLNMESPQTPEATTLFIRCGNAQDLQPLPVARQLAQRIGLASWRGWFEPYPGLAPGYRQGRAHGFEPWTNRWPDLASPLELAEIRLGGYLSDGRAGGFHIVQDGDGPTRWFAYAETCFEDAKPVPVERVRYPVLPRQDAQRRFFTDMDKPGWIQEQAKLQLLEYWQGQRLLAWLVVDKR